MYCSSCHADVKPVPPKTKWKILSVVMWIAMMAVSIAFALPIGLNVILVPAWFFLVGPSVGTAARLATTSTCPDCGADVVAPEEVVVSPGEGSPLRPAIPHPQRA